MVASIRIYFEGDDRLRMGFHRFLGLDAKRGKCRVFLVAAKGDPIGEYRIAQRKHPESINMLLLDSEQPLDGTGLRQQQVSGLPVDRIFWMVELMESWFLADRGALKRYYHDPQFQEARLPGHPDIEKIPKRDVEDGLKEATKNTRKGRYHKTKHAPGILETISPDAVAGRSSQCHRLLDVLSELPGAEQP